jgi:signal transduction histidine kinase
MKPKSDSLYRRGFWAYLVVVLAVYVQVFIYSHGPWRTWSNAWFVGLGAVYLVLGGAAPFWKWTCQSLTGKLVYLAVQLPLVTLLLFLSPVPGNVGLLVLPLVSQMVFMVPRALMGLFSTLLFVATLAHLAAPFGWEVALNNCFGYLAAFAFVIVFSVIGQREKTVREAAEVLTTQLGEANNKLREAAAQTEELAVARERNRLAREIHDGLGHYLTTIAVQLEAARALMAGSPDRAAEAVDKASHLAQEALADVRRSVGALRVDVPRQPLQQQLEQLAAADTGLVVALAASGTARELPADVEHALYRVAQEGLTNVRKHAGTARVRVTLDFRAAGRVSLEVADDGKGAGPDGLKEGFGLNGVRERIEHLGGRAEAAARPGGGFALRVEVPG